MNSNNALKVLFVHPDLGIGGAERLVVDAAMALQNEGHQVSFYTSHCDLSHAFEEVSTKQLEVTVWGDWLPRTVLGRFHALFAILRMLWVAFWIWAGRYECDVIFCDQVSYCVPILKWTGAKVLFYIHFPDKLLAQKGGLLKRCYRYPLDYLEEVTTKSAHLLAVNSKFTASIVRKHFVSLKDTPLLILNPTTMLQRPAESPGRTAVDELIGRPNQRVLLSINRFEAKKNLPLAVEAFALLNAATRWNAHLVLAGGCDERVEENARVYSELTRLIEQYQLQDHVTLAKNVSQELKMDLLLTCEGLIYTPTDEHFGIVPIEAMMLSRPVVASDSGGPAETVVNGETGYLCAPDSAHAFSKALDALLTQPERAQRMGKAGAARFEKLFGPQAFSRKLCEMVSSLAHK